MIGCKLEFPRHQYNFSGCSVLLLLASEARVQVIFHLTQRRLQCTHSQSTAFSVETGMPGLTTNSYRPKISGFKPRIVEALAACPRVRRRVLHANSLLECHVLSGEADGFPAARRKAERDCAGLTQRYAPPASLRPRRGCAFFHVVCGTLSCDSVKYGVGHPDARNNRRCGSGLG